MMAMGKLWDEAANTAEASDTSFLSRNSAADESEDQGQTLFLNTLSLFTPEAPESQGPVLQSGRFKVSLSTVIQQT